MYFRKCTYYKRFLNVIFQKWYRPENGLTSDGSRSRKLPITVSSVSCGIPAISSRMASISASRVRGRLFKTSALRHPHKKKSQGLKSEERLCIPPDTVGRHTCKNLITAIFSFLPSPPDSIPEQQKSCTDVIWTVPVQNSLYQTIWNPKSKGIFPSGTQWRLLYRCFRLFTRTRDVRLVFFKGISDSIALKYFTQFIIVFRSGTLKFGFNRSDASTRSFFWKTSPLRRTLYFYNTNILLTLMHVKLPFL